MFLGPKFLLLIAVAIGRLSLIQGVSPWTPASRIPPAARPRDQPVPETWSAAPYAGYHLPRQRKLYLAGKFFCTDEHRRLGLQSPQALGATGVTAMTRKQMHCVHAAMIPDSGYTDSTGVRCSYFNIYRLIVATERPKQE